MDEHRQESPEGRGFVSKVAPCRESMDALLFNYADEYLQDVNIYLRKVEEAIKINREMYSKTVNIIKKSRVKILWNKGNNKDNRNQLRKTQKDAMLRIIDARNHISQGSPKRTMY